MAIATRRAFVDAAEAAGLVVRYQPGCRHRRTHEILPFEIDLDAPAGKLFVSSGCHCDNSIGGDDSTTRTNWLTAGWKLQEILALGFEDCTDPECDICHP